MTLTQNHPEFVGWITLVAVLPIQLFLTLWAGLFFGGISTATFALRGMAPFVVFGLLAFTGVPFFAYFGKKLNYQRTTYTFYDDHIDFEEGFFSHNRKVVRYRDVVEVTLRKGVLQRMAGLGTICLATVATGSSRRGDSFNALGFGNVSASGIGLRDISEPDVAYDRIRNIVDRERPALVQDG